MTVLDAVEVILAAAAEPLHYNDIARRMATGVSQAKDVPATVRGCLLKEIKHRGHESRFTRIGGGMYGLQEWMGHKFSTPPPEQSPNAVMANSHDVAGDTDQDTEHDRAKDGTTPTGQRVAVLTFAEAAAQVLDTYSNREPMHYRSITRKALELGLIRTAGKTPEATLYAQLQTEIERQSRRGMTPRFVRRDGGFFGLSHWMKLPPVAEIERHNSEMRARLHANLHALSSDGFEALIGQLLGAIGFADVDVIGRSGDGGIDVRGTLVVGDVIRIRMAVQAKRWKGNVQRPIVQQLRGSLGAHDQGLIITTSDFSVGARDEALRFDAAPVGLMDGERLVDLLIEHSLGVRRIPYDVIEVDVPRAESDLTNGAL